MKNQEFSRRDFLKSTLGAGIALAGSSFLPVLNEHDPHGLPTALMGKTGVRVPRMALGLGSRFCTISDEAKSTEMLNYALDNGLYYWDTANFYQDLKNGVISEERIGLVAKHRRKEIFLSTKLSNRKPDDAMKEIETSLKRLQTDHLDMLMIHAVMDMTDVAKLSEKGNLIDFLHRLKDQKVTKYIGFSSHHNADAMTAMIERGDFDTMLMAMNQWGPKNPQQRQEMAMPAALKKEMGVIFMKVIRPKDTNPDLKGSDLVRFALSLKGPSAINVGMESLEVVKTNLDILRNYVAMTDEEIERYTTVLNQYFNNKSLAWMNPGYQDGHWA